jgi:hypothetical protein
MGNRTEDDVNGRVRLIDALIKDSVLAQRVEVNSARAQGVKQYPEDQVLLRPLLERGL